MFSPGVFRKRFRVPIYKKSVRLPFVAPPAVGAVMNQLQKSNLGADLYNGTLQ